MEEHVGDLIYKRIQGLKSKEKELDQSIKHLNIDIERNKKELMEVDLLDELSKVYTRISKVKYELYRLRELLKNK